MAHKRVWTPAQRKAFAEKMRKAREAKNLGRKRIHTKKFDRAVTKIKRSLKKRHAKGNAYAIAESKLGTKKSILKAHRRRKNATGWVILVKHGSHHYYMTQDRILSSSFTTAKRYTKSHAIKAARKIARLVPPGFKVYVKY